MDFDKLATLYVFCADYHGGQWSRLYRLMCRLESHYRLVLRGDWNEWRNTELYQYLESRYAKA